MTGGGMDWRQQATVTIHLQDHIIKHLGKSRIMIYLLSAVTHAPFHAPVLRPTSWPNARQES